MTIGKKTKSSLVIGNLLCAIAAVEFLRFVYFAAAQARRAHAHTFGCGPDPSVDRAQIDVPSPFGHVVGVADAVSCLRLLAADITLLCHDYSRKIQNLMGKTQILQGFGDFGNPRSSRKEEWPRSLGAIANFALQHPAAFPA